MSSRLTQPRQAIGNVGRPRQAVGNVGTQTRPLNSKLMQQLKRFNINQGQRLRPALGVSEKSATPIARMPKAAKKTTPRSVVPRGPRGLTPTPISQPPQRPRIDRPLREMPGGFGYGRSARGASGSRGRRNRKQFTPSMLRQPLMTLAGRQYSEGGLLKTAEKLNTGIKSGK